MPEDAQPEVGGALRAGGTRLGEGVSLSPGGGGGCTCHLPGPLCTGHPSSLTSRRKAVDTFSVAVMIINFKKFKSIHFSLKFEVCKGTGKEGTENAQLAGRVLVVTSFPIM